MMLNDASLQAILNGLFAALVGAASSFAIILSGLVAVGATAVSYTHLTLPTTPNV